MPRYIDADALIDDIRKHSESYFADDFAHEWVDKQPSADVQPVRHGHWIHDGLDIPHGVDWMRCSECGKRDKYCPATMTNYCPNCGAKMEGETNEQ